MQIHTTMIETLPTSREPVATVSNAYLQARATHRRRGDETYNREDELLDQLERLPSQEQIRQLVELLGKPSLKMLSEGLLIDGVGACKSLDILAVAKVLNSWTATVEEKVAAGNRINRILSRRRRVVGANG